MSKTDDKKTTVEELDVRLLMLEDLFSQMNERVEKVEKQGSHSIQVITEVERPNIPTEPFVFEKGKFKFKVAGLIHEGKKILAADALENLELQKIFVEEYPNTVEKIA